MKKRQSTTKGVDIHIKTPELDKLLKVVKESQAIGSFLDWAFCEQPALLQKTARSCHMSIETLLALYFNIDLNKVERERSAILSRVRAAHAAESSKT